MMHQITRISTARKIINILFFVLFTWSALIQLNDPDPFLWFTIYMAVALMPIIFMFRQPTKKFIWVIVIGLLLFALYHFAFFMDWLQTDHKTELFGEMVYDKPYLEGTREFLGLLIAAFSLTYQLKIAK